MDTKEPTIEQTSSRARPDRPLREAGDLTPGDCVWVMWEKRERGLLTRRINQCMVRMVDLDEVTLDTDWKFRRDDGRPTVRKDGGYPSPAVQGLSLHPDLGDPEIVSILSDIDPACITSVTLETLEEDE